MVTGILALRGLGPKSARWLAAAGVHTRQELEALGAVGAFRAVQSAGFSPSLNFLWALQGALMGIHWNQVPPSIKDRLRAELETSQGP